MDASLSGPFPCKCIFFIWFLQASEGFQQQHARREVGGVSLVDVVERRLADTGITLLTSTADCIKDKLIKFKFGQNAKIISFFAKKRYEYFGINIPHNVDIDHYVQVFFCMFELLF
ncbi:hypothetical protein [uncultured Muribaculum sp.]|uniref:hypothetical protein n=1 Tax=uncultured Muribaculum sp. TaxID=1918613 RepID=UPI0025F6866A|nr:hypothetical protein [uncultured Muribaculum sp.]